jgi:hypothetical protein
MTIAVSSFVTRHTRRSFVAASGLLFSVGCAASTCIVNSALDDPNDASAKVTSLSQGGWSGAQKNVVTLRDCIVESNLMTGSQGVPTTPGLTIELSKIAGAVITLQDNLPLLFNNVAIITTTGKPVAISGNHARRIFFVSGLPLFKSSNVPDPDGAQAIAVTLSNMLIEYGVAHGGDGAGGGMGAGGALFINKNATVTLANVSLKQNLAMGGTALNLDDYFALGGGGMGAGSNTAQGGGGLNGPSVPGYSNGAGIGTPGTSQFAGGFGGTGLGQISISQNFSKADFDVDTGSGTLGSLIGGGGLAGGTGTTGRPGGFGGGGAEAGTQTAIRAGDGGFGGGGAWAQFQFSEAGGNGGFGGGGGAGFFWTTSGNGGFGAGAGAVADFGDVGQSGVGGQIPALPNGILLGGGGAGFGGAIFVRSGGAIQIQSTTPTISLTDNSVVGGTQDYPFPYGTAAAAGAGLFVMTGAQTTFNIGDRYTISDDIADDSSLSLPTGQTYVPGNGGGAAVTKTGVGLLVIDGVDSRAGLTNIQSGALAGIGMIAGSVDLASSARILPGDPLTNGGIGTLTVGSLTWNGGGSMAFNLGADDSSSDHLRIVGALLKQGTGPFLFYFGIGAAPPTVGQTYRLISAADTSAFSAQDFSFENDSSLQSLNGKFSVDATGVYFSVTAVQP